MEQNPRNQPTSNKPNPTPIQLTNPPMSDPCFQVSRSDVIITKADQVSIFTNSDQDQPKIFKCYYIETRVYWVDCGDHADKETEDFKWEVYFSPEELMKYWVDYTTGIKLDRHENHDQIMVAGKFYKDLWDARVEQLIQDKMNALREHKIRVWKREQEHQARLAREQTKQPEYREKLTLIARKLQEIIDTIQNRNSTGSDGFAGSVGFTEFKRVHDQGSDMINSVISQIEDKCKQIKQQKSYLVQIRQHIESVYVNSYRSDLELSRQIARDQTKVQELDQMLKQLNEFDGLVKNQRHSHQSLLLKPEQILSHHNKMLRKIQNAASAYITDETYRIWIQYSKELDNLDNWRKFGWDQYDITEINTLGSNPLLTQPIPDLEQYMQETKAQIDAKSYRISFEGRTRRLGAFLTGLFI